MQTDSTINTAKEKMDTTEKSNVTSATGKSDWDDMVSKRENLYTAYPHILLMVGDVSQLVGYEPLPPQVLDKLDDWALCVMGRLLRREPNMLHLDQARAVGAFILKMIRESPLSSEVNRVLTVLYNLSSEQAVDYIVRETSKSNPMFCEHALMREMYLLNTHRDARLQFSQNLFSYYRECFFLYGTESEINDVPTFMNSDDYRLGSVDARFYRLNAFLLSKIDKFEKMALAAAENGTDTELKTSGSVSVQKVEKAMDDIIDKVQKERVSAKKASDAKGVFTANQTEIVKDIAYNMSLSAAERALAEIVQTFVANWGKMTPPSGAKFVPFTNGVAVCITGPMMAQKTTTLIRVGTTVEQLGAKVLYINHKKDTRFNNTITVKSGREWGFMMSHDSKKQEALMLENFSGLPVKFLQTYDMIIIDELHFFDPTVFDFIKRLKDLKKFVMTASINTDFKKHPFEWTTKIWPIFDQVHVLTAQCYQCKRPASLTARITDHSDRIVVGADMYRATCHAHHTIPAKVLLKTKIKKSK